ncbi:GNAT family N-acetyltransferase [Paenibacillus polygoni]|uniref:GNAT family N-acetyltransferase n=1 Tax=Paenibacillus polygoni TaxID=3050112 RepID=A0ABY8X1U1_9BACL|nr:GNAT family N-acetyltransferase [Paenibacillus polygoni]WIV18674.1 GNAT family N-acetyltransferase [Paenibacillus polygoni]
MEGKIIPISLQDTDLVLEIWRLQHLAYRLEAQWIGFNEIPPLLDTVETIQGCGESFFGYITDDMELLGAIAVETEEEGTRTISRMMVHPLHFRKGIAGQLIEYVLDLYRDVPKMIVSTGLKNIPASNLYQKYGFKPVETQEVAPGVELTTFHLNRINDRS